MPDLITIVPAFNEAATIADVVGRALAHAPVLVVDDGSTDETAARAASAGAEVIRHARRMGKGQAIRTGMTAAAIRGATKVITLDGDGQHDPDDIPRLRAVADTVPEALVIGARLAQSSDVLPGRLNAVRVAGFFVNWATGLHVEDTQSGFRLYPLGLARELRTHRGGFVFETEVLIAAARRGLAVREIPVRAFPRTAQRSRFRPVVDGVLIGAYLTERGLGRWLEEARAALAGVRADGVAEWWRHPRRRRAAAAAWGTVLSPVLLGLAVCQSLVGGVVGRLATRPAPDLVTPVVTRWFSQGRLRPIDGPEYRASAVAGNGSSAGAPLRARPGVPS
jgi:glycosyltransferase involved in cell wall biosynthesis